MNRYLSEDKAIELAGLVKRSGRDFLYDEKKHRLTVFDEAGKEDFWFRLPITVKSIELIEYQANYILLLIQSGSCSMGYYEGSKNMDHKVFKSYMVRQKQGKSQIKHLKTKGKSRAGSRVRLAETMDFFENINLRLQEYFSHHNIDKIAISCSKILIPYLHNSKVQCPFEKKDERIFKIPTHVNLPNHEVMNAVHQFLLKGELIYEEEKQELINDLLGNIFT